MVVDEQTRQGRSPAAGIADSVQREDAIPVVDFGREQPGFEHGAVASIYLNRPPLCNARRRRSGRLPGDAKRGFAEYGAAGETQKQNGGHGADHAQRPASSHRHYKTYAFVATYVQAAQRPVYDRVMNIDWIRKYCLSLPHSTETVQWSDDLVFKIAGKMYTVAALEPGDHWLSFKCSPDEPGSYRRHTWRGRTGWRSKPPTRCRARRSSD